MKINWKKIKEGTLLIVTWIDICENASWLEDSKAQSTQPIVCKNVGWFINDDLLSIRLSWSVASDGDKAITVIPKGVIREVKQIKYKR